MPTPAAFDYYEALEIERTATNEEIKSSYRRLARIHHPDKNLDNPESTAAFQKIQIAHETLSDERSRAIYDARSARSTNRPSNGRSAFYDSEDDDGYYSDYEYDTHFEDFLRSRHRQNGDFTRFFGGEGIHFAGHYFYNRQPPRMSPEEMRKEREPQQKAEASWRERILDEVRRRREGEQARENARAEAKAAEEAEKAARKAAKEQLERASIEKIWVESNAVTEAEKQDLCLHSVFWAKEKHPKKIKCTSCRQKRGMVGYRCPHCSLLVCQVCLNNLRES